MFENNFKNPALVMDPLKDQVAVAKEDIARGSILEFGSGKVRVKHLIRKGQRVAIRDIKKGEFLRQYGYPFAQSRGIRAGELVSLSKIKNILPDVGFDNYKEPGKTLLQRRYVSKNFLGFRRKNGTVGTRNYYLVVPTSMCASETALQIAAGIENNKALLKRYTNIDGVVAIAHTEGCGCDSGLQIDRLMAVLKGYISHPNVGGCLIIDLGCEQTNYQRMHSYLAGTVKKNLKPIDWVTIQDSGGTGRSTDIAKSLIKQRLPAVNRCKREPASIARLIVGTECGASDSFSGITANPVIGNVVDKVVFAGGSAILSEVTEMVGVMGMLLPRFRSLKIAREFSNILGWYTEIARKMGLTLEPNLVPKNIEGGLINNYIKSLGAVSKGGTTAIEDVIDYGRPLKKRGLNIMQGPGNDPESVTGLVSCGATVICFSTGKGTTTGEAICPVIKIASNRHTFRKLPNDMDFDASRILDEGLTLNCLGEELLEKVISVASGEKTWSEKWKQRQFQVWSAGKLSL